MEITYLQILGLILLYIGIHGFIKGKIEWEFEIGPSSGNSNSMFHIDLTPAKFRKRTEGVWNGRWVRPFCIFLSLSGLVFLFIVTGEKIAFSI